MPGSQNRRAIDNALQKATFESLVPAAIVLACLYVLVAIGHWWILTDTERIVMLVIAVSSSFAYFGFALLLQKQRISSRHAHFVAAVFAFVVLANVLSHTYLMRDEMQSVYVCIVLVGTGYLILSTRWYAAVVLCAILGWLATFAAAGLTDLVLNYLFIIVACAVLGAIVHAVRIRFLIRLERLRISDEEARQRVAELLEHSEENERRFRAVVDGALDGIIVFDNQGHIELCNPSAAAIFGYPAETILESNLKILLPEELWNKRDSFISRYIGTQAPEFSGVQRELSGRRSDGSTFTMDIAISVMPGESSRNFVAIVRDITERKETEILLYQAKIKAEEASTAKSLFLANMSHELRTPLNAIIGYSDMLVEDAQEENQNQLADDLTKIRTAGQHLLGLINDILDLSKIEAGRMEPVVEAFNVPTLVRDIETTVVPLAQTNGNTVKYVVGDDVAQMFSDQTKVRQCVLNLLSNACKFTKDGVIELNVERKIWESREFVSFRVKDTGIGMDTEQLHRVFDAFTQADNSTTRKFGGTGLGLAISRQLARILGGDIRAQSAPDVGSLFELILPLRLAPSVAKTAASEQSEEKTSEDERSRDQGWEVLLIDDDPMVRDLVRRALESRGWRMEEAENGKEGLERLASKRPQAILLDLMMPEMDGFEFLDAIRSNPEWADLPVIVISAKDLDGGERERLRHQVCTVLTKSPLRGESVVSALNRVLMSPPPREMPTDTLSET